MLSVVLIFLITMSACSGPDREGQHDSYIYCLNEDKTGIVKVEYESAGDGTQDRAEKMLERLKEPSDDIEYVSPIPENVKILGCTLSGSILNVNFSKEYLEIGGIDEKLIRAAVVQSLIQIDEINGVTFEVEGKPLLDGDGTAVGFMNEDDFVENTGSSPSAYQTAVLKLYFANAEGDKLVEVKQTVRYSSNVSIDKLIVEKLLQGPVSGTDAYPTINPDTNLLSVTTKDGICYVNFDSTFLNGKYDVIPQLTVYSIVDSLVEGTKAEQVQITVNGESNAKYMDTVDLSKPLKGDMSFVAVEDKK